MAISDDERPLPRGHEPLPLFLGIGTIQPAPEASALKPNTSTDHQLNPGEAEGVAYSDEACQSRWQ